VQPTLPHTLTSPAVRSRVLASLLILSAVVAYLPAINAGFIWDDDLLLTANRQLQTVQGMADIWRGKNSCDYTPLTLTTFWLEKRLWQDAATGYHVVNVLLHAAATVLLWRILLALGIPGGWLAALLFAIHPVNVASVAWIAERKNTLSTVLGFASILAFILAYQRKGTKRYLVSIVLFLMAGLSKGAVVTIPVVLGGCILWLNHRMTRRDFISLTPFLMIALITSWLTIRYQAAASDYALPSSALVFRVARAGCLPWLYLREVFVPIGLSPMTPMWQPNLCSPVVYLSPLLILAMVALFFWKRHTWGRPLLFASSYYLLMLLPVLGIVWMGFQQQTPCADWWQYLAVPGVFAAVAGGAVAAINLATKNVRVYSQLAICLLAAMLLTQTWRRCGTYQSMESYCRAVLSENPHAWTLQNNLGIILKNRGEFVQAAVCYRQALSDNPKAVKAHNNLGNALSATGNYQEAEAEFLTALNFNPSNPNALASLSQNYFLQGKIREASAAAAKAVKTDPSNPDRYVQLGATLNASGKFNEGAACFRNALILRPGDTRTALDLATTLISAGRHAEAAAVCDEALQMPASARNEQVMQSIAMLRDQCRSRARQ
jgi:protein O-mannosyl-transferase